MQYLPKDGLYIYFRYDEKQTIMCVMNTDEKERSIDFDDYAERTKGFTKATDIVTGQTTNSKFQIPAKAMWVLELGK